jgi:hypothetical protein
MASPVISRFSLLTAGCGIGAGGVHPCASGLCEPLSPCGVLNRTVHNEQDEMAGPDRPAKVRQKYKKERIKGVQPEGTQTSKKISVATDDVAVRCGITVLLRRRSSEVGAPGPGMHGMAELV